MALLFLFFHKRLCGPLANSRFHHQPDPQHRPNSPGNRRHPHSGRSIRAVSSSHFAQLRELFKTVWGAKRSEEYDAKYWNETLLGECPAVLGLWGKQVVGAYMIWPMQFSDS